MSRKLKALLLVCCFAALMPALAANPSLTVQTLGVSGSTVTVSVHNAGTAPVSTRVTVTVTVDNGGIVKLTSGTVLVPGGATIAIPMSAPKPVTVIDDDPEPV